MDVVGAKDPPSGILSLHDDFLRLIFDKLDLNLDQKSFGLTCHHFLDIQNSSLKRLELGDLPSKSPSSNNSSVKIDSHELDKLLNRFRQLQWLSLRGRVDFSDSGLIGLKNYGSKLHSLYLDNCQAVTDLGISYIAVGCPSLSVISLAGCSIKDVGLEILTESCKSLKEVNLACCVRISDYGIWALSQNCRQLRALKISKCDRIVGVSFQGCSPTLTCLEADGCAFDPMGITGILSGGGLQYLNLSHLHECSRGHGLGAIGLGIAANLKILDFSMCAFVTDDVILKISRGCPLLQEWNLSGCIEIDYDGWRSIGLYCRKLIRLDVHGCLKICDRGLLALGKGCKRLTVIYMNMKKLKLITSSGISVFKMTREDVIAIKKEAMKITRWWAFTT